jgi:uncharacterized protein YjiS (DUF1127 family)
MFTTANTLLINPGRPFRDRLKSDLATSRRRAFEKRSIAQLHKMDERMLKDIGLTRGDVIHARPRTLKEIGF